MPTIRSITLFLALITAASASSQTVVSYYHDKSKMNQITVMETGLGSLYPTVYYRTMHNSYRQDAAARNKMVYRTEASISAYQQVSAADSIRSMLERRSELEAMGMAERSTDVAWIADGDKITEKLESFRRNITRITTAGGTAADRTRWTEYYNMFQCAVRSTQDSYLPSEKRKQQYLTIYQDLCRQNDLLISYLITLASRSRTEELLSASITIQDRRSSIASDAHGRWRSASLLSTQE